MEEWKYEDFKTWIFQVKENNCDPNNIWDSITPEITKRKDSISPDNLDMLFFKAVTEELLSLQDLGKFFMIAHMYGHPWKLFKTDYGNLLSRLIIPQQDYFFQLTHKYEELPDTIEVYRVLNGVREIDLINIGYCWSLSKQKAMNVFGGEYGALIVAKVLKSDVTAFFDYRDEVEAVIIPEKVNVAKVLFYSNK